MEEIGGEQVMSVGETIMSSVRDQTADIIRASYVEAWNCPPSEIPDDVVNRETRKLELMLDGDYGEEYDELLHGIIRDHIGMGLDHASYLRAYGVFAANLVTALEDGMGFEAPQRGQHVRYLLLATHTEAGQALSYFFKAVDTQEWAERAALAHTFEEDVLGSVTSVGHALDAVEGAARRLAEGGQEASDVGQDGVVRAQEASDRVAEVAAAAQEISSAATDLANQVQTAATTAGTAREGAEKAEETVEALARASTQIGEVVKMIRSIAEQTRMLALNASIEAARAGEAGRGFAVVADEVKTLAHDTAKATDGIAHQVDSVQKKAVSASQAMREVRSAISGIDDAVRSIAALGEQQNTTTSNIASRTEATAANVRAMSDQTKAMAGFARQTSDESVSVDNQVMDARNALSGLEQTLRDFLQSMQRES